VFAGRAQIECYCFRWVRREPGASNSVVRRTFKHDSSFYGLFSQVQFGLAKFTKNAMFLDRSSPSRLGFGISENVLLRVETFSWRLSQNKRRMRCGQQAFRQSLIVDTSLAMKSLHAKRPALHHSSLNPLLRAPNQKAVSRKRTLYSIRQRVSIRALQEVV